METTFLDVIEVREAGVQIYVKDCLTVHELPCAQSSRNMNILCWTSVLVGP